MSRFVVVGAGLAGSLMALYLARQGAEVEVYERRGDLRKEPVPRGRSINLALSTRGIHALEEVGMARKILDLAIPMKGRMIHAHNGRLSFQPYGTREEEVIYSVSRAGLNAALLDEAERHSHVALRFHHKCVGLDPQRDAAKFEEPSSGHIKEIEGCTVIGADGAHSAVRQEMQKLDRFQYHQDYLEWGYKELSIPPGPAGTFLMEKNALHIWPRRNFMLIALPNLDGSFTCTLFLPFEQKDRGWSFEALSQNSEAEVPSFFEQEFGDVLPLMPSLADDFHHNPTSSLVYVRCFPWHHRDRVVLVGDACHAVVPFYGQGMNAAFEDCSVLNRCLETMKPSSGLEDAFSTYEELRKPNADALADLALENFVEMRDKVASRAFLIEKKLEKTLHRLFPGLYLPLYSMVTFSRMPYAEAVKQARKQTRWLKWIGLSALALLAFVIFALASFG